MRIARSAILGEENTTVVGRADEEMGRERKETREMALLHIFRL